MLPRVKTPHFYDSGEPIFTGDVIKVELIKKFGYILHHHWIYGYVFEDKDENFHDFAIKRLDYLNEGFCLGLREYNKVRKQYSIIKIGEVNTSEDYDKYLELYRDFCVLELYPGKDMWPGTIESLN